MKIATNTTSSLLLCMIFYAVLQIKVKYNLDLRVSMTINDPAARQYVRQEIISHVFVLGTLSSSAL